MGKVKVFKLWVHKSPLRFISVCVLLLVFGITSVYLVSDEAKFDIPYFTQLPDEASDGEEQGGLEESLHPLTIDYLRKLEYPGSDIVTEQILSEGSNYKRYIVSYKSDGLKIFGLLTIPKSEAPQSGFPVIIFNHGYIPPKEYRTTEKYIAYTDAFSRSGYVVFKPDYRGHGSSEGVASGGYGSNDYTIDVLNAVASIKRFNDQISSSKKIIDPTRIGMWGHSMGGHITLRSMVVSKDIKAGVIWAGVVGSYPDLLNNWRRRSGSASPSPASQRRWRQVLVDEYGEPEANPQFWDSISATNYLTEISGPLELHHGTADTSVPVEFSQKLYERMKSSGKEVEFFSYPGDDHNISANLSIALQRSVNFFDTYLK